MKALLQDEAMGREKRWKARSRFRRLSYARGFSFVEIEMATGVTHQIRVHMDAIGHPVAGDPLYARAHPSLLGRQFLHAFRIEFRHPGTGIAMAIESPLPQDLKEVLEKLGMKVAV